MNITIIANIRSDRARKDGTCAIVLRILYNRKVVATESIGKYVEASDWDDMRRNVKRTHPNAHVINAAIVNRTAEIQKLMNKFEIEQKTPTPAGIKNLLDGKDAGADFYKYCLEYIPVKYCKDDQSGTRQNYYSDLTKLRKYAPELNFYDIDFVFLEKYRAYLLMELKNQHNTVWKALKFIRTMFTSAIKAKVFRGEDPFLSFNRGKYEQGSRNFMEIDDCKEIHKLLQSDITESMRDVGYYYLFMCYTGFRYTTATALFNYDIHVIKDTRIIMPPQKKGMEVNIYIHELLRPVLNYIRHHKIKMTSQHFNKYLKVIGTLAKIKIPLTAHVGRHTFGGILAELDTPIKVAQKLLGHKEIASTEIYFHMRDKSLDKAMKGFDSL
jgi:site-specific recombinase XerD